MPEQQQNKPAPEQTPNPDQPLSNKTYYSKQGEQFTSEAQSGTENDPGDYGHQGLKDEYSYQGPHGEFADEETSPDGYGDQDQFGDVDGQDPYSNLDDQDPAPTAGGEALDDPEATLYGLAEPLAQPGDISKQGSDKDRHGTKRSQDQQGYQQ